MTRPGDLPLEVVANPEPNRREREIAREIAWSLGYAGSIADDPTNVAGMLALIREGYSLEGPRVIVSGTATLSRYVLEGPDRDRGLELTSDHAWRSWFGELRRRQLRPCGWPREDRVKVRSPQLVAGEATWIELEDDATEYEYLVISVTCEAVPIT